MYCIGLTTEHAVYDWIATSFTISIINCTIAISLLINYYACCYCFYWC